MPKELVTKDEFKSYVTDVKGKLIVVDFWATWCGPCLAFAPTFEGYTTTYPDVDFYKVDVDKNSETSEDEEISAMPTFKFYKDGVCVETIVGASAAKVEDAIKKYK